MLVTSGALGKAGPGEGCKGHRSHIQVVCATQVTGAQQVQCGFTIVAKLSPSCGSGLGLHVWVCHSGCGGLAGLRGAEPC